MSVHSSDWGSWTDRLETYLLNGVGGTAAVLLDNVDDGIDCLVVLAVLLGRDDDLLEALNHLILCILGRVLVDPLTRAVSDILPAGLSLTLEGTALVLVLCTLSLVASFAGLLVDVDVVTTSTTLLLGRACFLCSGGSLLGSYASGISEQVTSDKGQVCENVAEFLRGDQQVAEGLYRVQSTLAVGAELFAGWCVDIGGGIEVDRCAAAMVQEGLDLVVAFLRKRGGGGGIIWGNVMVV